MGVPLEVRTESALQGEVLRGGPSNRRWPDEVERLIVAETLVPMGGLEIAARYGLKPNHVPERLKLFCSDAKRKFPNLPTIKATAKEC
jgi:hypothetical protein